jgi:protoporphyrinogen oxidase
MCSAVSYYKSRLVSQVAFVASPQELGLKDLIQPTLQGVVEGSHGLVGEGLSTLFDRLASECEGAGVKIKLQSEVTKVEFVHEVGARKISVVGQDDIYAKCVIVTMPIGVLKEKADQLFSPQLSPKKVQAIDNIGEILIAHRLVSTSRTRIENPRIAKTMASSSTPHESNTTNVRAMLIHW